MTLRFDQPWYFLGLIICIPMAWAAVRWFVAMSGARRWSAIVLRTALVGVLLAMLAGASMVRTSDRIAVIACIDASGSVSRFFDAGIDAQGAKVSLSDAVKRFLDGSSRSRRADDLSGVVVFGGAAAPAAIAGAGPFAIPAELVAPEGRDATSIEGALRLAGAMIPPDAVGRIVLFSDGVETEGSGLSAARALAAREGARASGLRRAVPIDVVPLNYDVSREVVVESVDSPPTAQSGATVAVRVVLSATERAEGTLELLREGRPVDINGDAPGSSVRMTLEPGRTIEVFKVPLPEGRMHRFEAVWTPDADVAGADTVSANNRFESVTVSPGRGAVLIVDGVGGGAPAGTGGVLGKTLADAGMQVEMIGAEAMRADLLWMQQYDLIVLQNIPADAMAREAHATLASAVMQLGVGLIMVGGPDSFGAGGWKGTDIEPILPVRLDLPERLVTPAAAVILVIDNSGSMNRPVLGSSRSQQAIANEGAAQAIESMDKTDLIGVITFNSDFSVDIPLKPNSDAKAAAKLVRGIAADGGTNMPPALREAHRQMKGAQADIKHVIVLSDGVSQGKRELPSMVEEMAADGIMVSAISIGNDADVTGMREIAQVGKGQFYRVIDPTVLPRVLLKAVRIVRSPLVREGIFTPVVVPSGSPVMEGLSAAFGAVSGGGVAPLKGLVLTQARTDPTVVYTLAAPKDQARAGGGEPILGYWNAGLGRVAAFTSDAHAKWGGPWLDANNGAGYSRFWTQLARTIARPPSSRTQELTASIDGERMTIRLQAMEEPGAGRTMGRPLDGLVVPGTVYAPDGSKREVQLAQIGPGEYEAVVDLGGANAAGSGGSMVVTLSPRQVVAGQAKLLPPVIGGITRPPGEEYRRLRSDDRTLRAIAEVSGGRVISLNTAQDKLPDLYSRDGIVPAETRTPLWPLLAVAAVALMLLDVATRRVAWDRLLSREMAGEVGRAAAAAMADRTVQAAAAAERLRGATESGATEPSQAPVGPGPLGEADADAIAQREAERRRGARLAARRAAATSPQEQPPPPEPAPEETGLRAAKRRARDRMDE